MRFASQEFFDKLKESIMDENSDDSIYTELYEVLLHDTKYRKSGMWDLKTGKMCFRRLRGR